MCTSLLPEVYLSNRFQHLRAGLYGTKLALGLWAYPFWPYVGAVYASEYPNVCVYAAKP
jgi:hypothetical protein